MGNNRIGTSDGEFSGGPGMIDATRRAERDLRPEEVLWEIYATDPLDPKSTPENSVVDRP